MLKTKSQFLKISNAMLTKRQETASTTKNGCTPETIEQNMLFHFAIVSICNDLYHLGLNYKKGSALHCNHNLVTF